MHLKMCNSCMKLYKLYLHGNSHILILYLSPCSSIFHVNSCRKNTPTRWVARVWTKASEMFLQGRWMGKSKKQLSCRFMIIDGRNSWDRHVKPCTKLQVNPRMEAFCSRIFADHAAKSRNRDLFPSVSFDSFVRFGKK